MKRLSSQLAAFGCAGALLAAVLLSAAPSFAAHDSAAAATADAAPAAGVKGRDSYEGPPLLLGGKKLKIGAYASLGGAYTRMIGHDSGLVSFEGALLLDHRFSIGFAGYGFTRTPPGPRAFDGSRQQFGAGYGGLALRYSVFGGLPVYGTFGLVLGAGAVSLHRANGWDDQGNWQVGFEYDSNSSDVGRFDAFLFAQPEVALNTNVTRWLRLGASLGYRFTGGVSRFDLSESDLNGIVAGGKLELGWF